jgi:hypothetical protein
MTALQKWAWFNLLVVGLTLAVVLGALPFMGKGAMGGFGFLGFMGFAPLFYRKSGTQVLTDERDQLINRHAWFLAYSLFWVIYVLVSVFLSAWIYGWEGAVPVWVVQSSVFVALMFVTALASIAILIQYAGGASNAG